MRRNNPNSRFRKRVFTDREKRRIRMLHADGFSIARIMQIMGTYRTLIREVLRER